MTRALIKGAGSLLLLALWPAAAFVQASITGLVRNTFGAVLPGVTVEAANHEGHGRAVFSFDEILTR